MRLLLFILLIPTLCYSQISVIEVAPQPNVFESYGGEVIEEGWPTERADSWYGDPDIRLSNSQTSAVWFSTELGPRTFYTNISENQRINRGDSIYLVSGGGLTYEWNTGEKTRSIKVSPTDTTTYSVIIQDDIEYSPERSDTLSVTVFVEDRPLSPFPKSLTIGTDRTICEGTTITLTSDVEETPTITYLWSTGERTRSITITPSLSNTYTCTVTDLEFFSVLEDEIYIHVEKCN